MDESEDEGMDSEGEQVLDIKRGADGHKIKKNTHTSDPMNVEIFVNPAPKQSLPFAKIVRARCVKKPKM